MFKLIACQEPEQLEPETDDEEETEQEVVFVTLKATSVIKISAIGGKPDKGCYCWRCWTKGETLRKKGVKKTS